MKICIVTVTRNSTSVHLQYHRTVYSIIVQSTVTQRCQTQESDPAVSFPAMGKAIGSLNPEIHEGKAKLHKFYVMTSDVYLKGCTVYTVQYNTK